MSSSDYVEETNGAYRIRGTRVSLDSVVYAFLNGEPPETIARAFPVLNLEQVYGAITYYLAHRAEIDSYLEQARDETERNRRASRKRNPELSRKLAKARSDREPSRGQELVRRLRGSATVDMTSDEIADLTRGDD